MKKNLNRVISLVAILKAKDTDTFGKRKNITLLNFQWEPVIQIKDINFTFYITLTTWRYVSYKFLIAPLR